MFRGEDVTFASDVGGDGHEEVTPTSLARRAVMVGGKLLRAGRVEARCVWLFHYEGETGSCDFSVDTMKRWS